MSSKSQGVLIPLLLDILLKQAPFLFKVGGRKVDWVVYSEKVARKIAVCAAGVYRFSDTKKKKTRLFSSTRTRLKHSIWVNNAVCLLDYFSSPHIEPKYNLSPLSHPLEMSRLHGAER